MNEWAERDEYHYLRLHRRHQGRGIVRGCNGGDLSAVESIVLTQYHRFHPTDRHAHPPVNPRALPANRWPLPAYADVRRGSRSQSATVRNLGEYGIRSRLKFLQDDGKLYPRLRWQRRRVPEPNVSLGEGHRISTARVESTVDQLVDWRMEKKQHMRWTKRGAQMLLHARCALLNGELSKYSGWSPLESSPVEAVAA
jgi:hypothetical protein